ncbi:hypothetical protein SLPG_00028 [Salicola phage CGphi29]|uniref:hypothetical protein n=1 Tax=Salicola phage CGphi29 TaxID=754067 RepID=UPI0002C0E4B6|nr:hypothetical protein SLPG_00028 [Salicola phage CGphi29]AGH31822.1 hypothetical protein SLPG_00028 [Salicola phage CGphi29]
MFRVDEEYTQTVSEMDASAYSAVIEWFSSGETRALKAEDFSGVTHYATAVPVSCERFEVAKGYNDFVPLAGKTFKPKPEIERRITIRYKIVSVEKEQNQ